MTEDDLADLAGLLGDPQVMRFYPQLIDRAGALAWIRRNQNRYRESGFGLWRVGLRETDEFVGDCGYTLQEVEGRTDIEVGYHIRADLQGLGYATEAATACRDHARDAHGVHRMIAIINPDNTPSQRVATKIGLRFERRAQYRGRTACIYAADL